MNELQEDLKEKLEDPRFWSDEFLQEQVREILCRYEKEARRRGAKPRLPGPVRSWQSVTEGIRTWQAAPSIWDMKLPGVSASSPM
jgi:hypothetical protein